MIRKILSVVLLVISFSYGKENIKWDTVFYSAVLNYSNSIRDTGFTGGIYTYFGYGLNHSFEGSIDFTRIKYFTKPDLNQYDISLLYTYYYQTNSKYRFGYHYIISDDVNTDGGGIFTLGYDYYKLYRYLLGFDIHYSIYPNYQTQKKSKLLVFQLTPVVSLTFGNYYKYGSFTLTVKGYYIKLSEDTGFGKNFISAEGSLDYYIKNITTGFSIWGGEQSFAVKNHGFVVYNLSEKYSGGYTIYVRYTFNPKFSVKAGYNYFRFKELGSTKYSEGNLLLLTLGASF
ncbi:hypothetical protein [Persephonella sp.]